MGLMKKAVAALGFGDGAKSKKPPPESKAAARRNAKTTRSAPQHDLELPPDPTQTPDNMEEAAPTSPTEFIMEGQRGSADGRFGALLASPSLRGMCMLLDSPGGSASSTPTGPTCTGGGRGEAPSYAGSALPLHPRLSSTTGRQPNSNSHHHLPSPLCTATATPLARHIARRALRKAGDSAPISLPSISSLTGGAKIRDVGYLLEESATSGVGDPSAGETPRALQPLQAPHPPGLATPNDGRPISPRMCRSTTLDVATSRTLGRDSGEREGFLVTGTSVNVAAVAAATITSPTSPSAISAPWTLSDSLNSNHHNHHNNNGGYSVVHGANMLQTNSNHRMSNTGRERFSRMYSLQNHASRLIEEEQEVADETAVAVAVTAVAAAAMGTVVAPASASSPLPSTPQTAPAHACGGLEQKPVAISTSQVQPPRSFASVAKDHLHPQQLLRQQSQPQPPQGLALRPTTVASLRASHSLQPSTPQQQTQLQQQQRPAAGLQWRRSIEVVASSPTSAMTPTSVTMIRTPTLASAIKATTATATAGPEPPNNGKAVDTEPELTEAVGPINGIPQPPQPQHSPQSSQPQCSFQPPQPQHTLQQAVAVSVIDLPLEMMLATEDMAAAAAEAQGLLPARPEPLRVLSNPPSASPTSPGATPPSGAGERCMDAVLDAGEPPVTSVDAGQCELRDNTGPRHGGDPAGPQPTSPASWASPGRPGSSPVSDVEAAAAALAAVAAAGQPLDSFTPRPVPPPGLVHFSAAAPANMLRSSVSWGVSDYKVVRKLYAGYASSVYKATCLYSGVDVVLKAYNLASLSTFLRNQVLRELSVHSRLRHPGVVHLMAAFREGDLLILVLEYVRGGSVDRVRRKLGGRMTEFQALHLVLLPLLGVLAYLHSRGIAHRDIKAENLLFTESWQLKVCDYGVSICLQEERAVTRTGSREYMAPEVNVCPLKRGPEDNKDNEALSYTSAVDVWSLGALMYELLVGFAPFPGGPPSRKDGARGSAGRALAFPAGVSQGARAFVWSCLELHPADRPTVQQLLRHPWILEALEHDGGAPRP